MHPQFTEPHAALEQAGHRVTPVVLPEPFTLDPAAIPEDADLVVIGNPTNPTGVLHPADEVRALLRPGRVVVVDEAFMDCVPGKTQSLAGVRLPGLVVLRSLTKHWGIPGIRAGYVVGDALVVAGLALNQTPWSVGATAARWRSGTGASTSRRASPTSGSPSSPRPPRSCWRGSGRACTTRCRPEGSRCAGPTPSRASTGRGCGSPSVRPS